MSRTPSSCHFRKWAIAARLRRQLMNTPRKGRSGKRHTDSRECGTIGSTPRLNRISVGEMFVASAVVSTKPGGGLNEQPIRWNFDESTAYSGNRATLTRQVAASH